MHIIWFIAAAVFTLFAILLIVRVIQRKRQLGDVADAVAQLDSALAYYAE